jgi:hypothetical protein
VPEIFRHPSLSSRRDHELPTCTTTPLAADRVPTAEAVPSRADGLGPCHLCAQSPLTKVDIASGIR